MKAVFDTKPTSVYDDDIFSRYHVPKRYLKAVEATVGDWVVLRRPRADGGNLAYFATARVSHIEPDPAASSMSYARLTNFLGFDAPVPWRIEGRYAEEALRNVELQFVGRCPCRRDRASHTSSEVNAAIPLPANRAPYG